MTTIPQNRTHLAEMLGVAKSAVTAQAKRGMPTDSLEAARAWREANLNIARRKGIRFDQHYQPPGQQGKPPPPPVASLAAQASALMDAASALLAAHQSITAMVPYLRTALHAVPKTERDSVGLNLDVMRLLLADVMALLPADRNAKWDDGSPVYLDRDMTDSEAQVAGEFWYQVAAGEWLFPAPALPPGTTI